MLRAVFVAMPHVSASYNPVAQRQTRQDNRHRSIANTCECRWVPTGSTMACAGHDGDAATRPSPALATADAITAGQPPGHHLTTTANYSDHEDLQLKG
jgi:hypothetical protein